MVPLLRALTQRVHVWLCGVLAQQAQGWVMTHASFQAHTLCAERGQKLMGLALLHAQKHVHNQSLCDKIAAKEWMGCPRCIGCSRWLQTTKRSSKANVVRLSSSNVACSACVNRHE